MKTNLILLLAITLSAHPALAGRPALPSANSTTRQMPSMRPAAKLPSMPKMRPAAPPMQRLAPSRVPMVKPIARPAIMPKPAGVSPQLGSKATLGRVLTSPSLPSPNKIIPTPIPNRLGANTGVLREGRDIANSLKGMKELRIAGAQSPLPAGLPKHQGVGGGPKGVADPRTESSPVNRTPVGPVNYTKGGGDGFTDFRADVEGSARGQSSDSTIARERGRDSRRYMSPTGRALIGEGAGFGRINHSDGSYDRWGVREPAPNSPGEAVYEHHDSSGNITGFTEQRIAEGANGNGTTETVHRDASGDAQDVVLVEHNGHTNTDTKTVYDADGNVLSRTQGCDRNPEGSSTGGPVNGNRGSVQEQLGLKPIDLLRQPTEDPQSGGVRRADRIFGGRQVRPVSSESNTGIGGNRNRVQIDQLAPIKGGGTDGGGDRPN